jgi:CBS domain-containing protein
LILPTKLPEASESLATIFRDFSLPDRLRLVREISTEGPITKTTLRKRVYFPGSLDHNLAELKSRHAITINNDMIKPGNDFRKYCDALDCLLSAVKEARGQRAAGNVRVLLVSHLMTERASWKTIDPNENLSQAVDRMLEESVQGLVVRFDTSVKILNRLLAFKAYQKGVPGSTLIADLKTDSNSDEYLIDPIDSVEPNESVASLAMKMYDQKVSYALVRKDGSPEGLVALSDILNLYRDQESPTK